MKNNIIFILLFIIMLRGVDALENASDSYLGQPLISNGLVYDNMKIDSSTLTIQNYNANDRQQLSTEAQVNEFLKQNLIQQANDGWGYVIGYLFLLKETFILLFFLIEMRFIIWFLVILIPKIFLKLRDSIVNFYRQRAE